MKWPVACGIEQVKKLFLKLVRCLIFPLPLTIVSTNSCSPSLLAPLYSLRTLQSTAGYQGANGCHQRRLWKWLVWNPCLSTSFPESAGMVLLSLSLVAITLVCIYDNMTFEGTKDISQLVVKPVYCFLYRQGTDCISNTTHMALCTTQETFLKNCFVKFEMLIKKKKSYDHFASLVVIPCM